MIEETTQDPTRRLFDNGIEFSQYIETLASKTGISCMRAVLDYCEAKDIDPLYIAHLIRPSLKGKIQLDMIEAGLMPPQQSLEDL